MKRRINVIVVAAAGLAAVFTGHAGEIGHFNGAVMNIRDYVMPDPGWYTAIYNYFYMTDQLNNANGDAINSIIIKPSPGPAIKLSANVDVDLYALVPTLIWVTDVKPLGIKYGALISPSFVNANLNAEIDCTAGTRRQCCGRKFRGRRSVCPACLAGKVAPALGFWVCVRLLCAGRQIQHRHCDVANRWPA